MTPYLYHMVQIPPTLVVKQAKGGEAAAYLESVVMENAKQGWEFWRVDTIGVAVPPGCIGALLGHSAAQQTFSVITFRREAQSGTAR